jgi:glycosyltransferase involved in cell wall biosynthesis
MALIGASRLDRVDARADRSSPVLERITPVVLTYNEAPNIARVLERLRWARDVVVVDSHSTDATRRIVEGFPNTRLFTRPFDSHLDQWTYAIGETSIGTDWVLRLDADHLLTEAVIGELANLDPPADVVAYLTPFSYSVYGTALRESVYMPAIRLMRRGRTRLYHEGHCERVAADGRVGRLRNPVVHDDRKPLERFLASQMAYMRLEAETLVAGQRAEPRLIDRLRRRKFIAPFAVLLYCLFAKRLILDGLPGVFYAFQRAFAEFTLSLYLIDAELRRREQTG